MIGSGNVAHHIAVSFKNTTTLSILQVFNHRATKKSKAFAKENHCEFISDYSNINTSADLYFICVKDDAMIEVVKHLIPLNLKGLVVHTSGSVTLSVLKNTSANIGVYYPLQSFSASDTINWKNTPILIEANSKKSESLLKAIATSVSDTVKIINSEKRLQFHLAAVFACNFTNSLYHAAFGLIETTLSKKDSNLLLPMMTQSFHKLSIMTPKQAQTGPAMRKDTVVLKKHLELLKSNKQLSAVYKLVSELIVSQQTM
jgi:predicted short-subunit dehydrogenase-like oxidoreductase (DUF2520 family)